MKRPRSKVSPKLCKMQNRQVFSWMEKPAFVANCIVGAGVLYHCRCLCCTNQPTNQDGVGIPRFINPLSGDSLKHSWSLSQIQPVFGQIHAYIQVVWWFLSVFEHQLLSKTPLYCLCWCPRSIKSWTLFGDSFHRLPPPESHNSGFPNLFPTWFVLPITPDRPRV